MNFKLNKTEEKKLLALFDQHEINIDYLLYLKERIWNNPGINSSIFTNKSTFEKRTLFIDELLKIIDSLAVPRTIAEINVKITATERRMKMTKIP